MKEEEVKVFLLTIWRNRIDVVSLGRRLNV